MNTKTVTAQFKIVTILDEAERDLKNFSAATKDMWKGQEPPKSISKALEELRQRVASIKETSKGEMLDSSGLAQVESDYKAFRKTLKGLGVEYDLFTEEQKKAMLGREEADNIKQRKAAMEAYNKTLKENVEISKKRQPLETEISERKGKIKAKKGANTRKEKKIAAIESGKPVASKEVEQHIKNLERQKQLQQELAVLEKDIAKKRDAGSVPKEGTNYARQLERQAELKRELASIDVSSGAAEFQKYTSAIADADAQIDKLTQEIEDNKKTIKTEEAAISGLEKQLDKLVVTDETQALTDLKTGLEALGVTGINTETTFDQLKQAVTDLDNQALAQVDTRIQTATNSMRTLGTTMDQVETQIDETSASIKAQNDALNDQRAFMSRIKQFVGLEGAAMLARRALQSAFSTIKELDAAMTEMAVVTDLDVGDYWEQLPEHTNRANALGMSIKSVYEAETLYYQQGLKTNEVVAMSTETLKMARIAGLSAEEATNKMTAALRGFNMELNETSAQRVADVYSQLAAITASDVDEISSAMTKTASIASSAGMEFETTAAFLSQIIETTRESAETAGTALKTVIARFQELKKDPAEIGEVDGEIVDANKIETALRTVDVSLRDASGQFRELDDVFLELSSKWDTLDTNTQRYIATIAAGSRQQSRFIAMMSDYSRTQELVTAANSSAGASNKQFEKTMDSLESKLSELKNAWDSFTMGIMDSNILKMGIDLLTGLLTIINKITDAFGDFSGAAKIGLLVAALYLGDKALKVFMGSLQGGSTIFQAFGATGRVALDSINKRFISLKKLVTKQTNIKLNSTQVNKATDAVYKHNMATKQLQISEQKRNAAAQAGELTDAKAAMYSQAAAEAKEKQAQAALELAAATGLNAVQTQNLLGLTGMGLATDKALILTKAGLTVKNFEQAASLFGVEAATIANNYAAKLENATGLKALLLKGSLTASTWLYNVAKKAETKGLFGGIPAKVADIAANWGMQASMWPILVIGLLLVAAIGLLVLIIWAVVAAIQAFNKNSPEGKLKSAEEAANAAAEAAERTAQAYNDLVDAVENLSDKYSALEEMTRGTQEWRDAVKEVNDQVLSLVEEYPELAALVKNENGVLTLELESKEVQDVLNKYEKQSAAAANASLAAKINVNEKKANVTSSDLVNKNTIYTGDVSYSMSKDTMQEMAAAMNSGDLRDTDGDGKLVTEMTEWLKANGATSIETTYAASFAALLANDTEALKEFGTELYAMAEQERVYKEQMAQNAIGMVDATKYSEEQLRQMDVAASADFADSFTDQYEEQFANMDKNSEELTKAKEDVAKNLYGEDATVSGNTITYYDEEGEKQTKKLTNEEFKEQWAAIQATSAMTEAFEQLPKTIDKISAQMSSSAGKAFKAMYAGKEGSAMTKADIEAAGQVTQGELVTIWNNLTEEEKKAYGSFEQLQKQYNDSVAAGNAALTQAQEAAKNAGIELMDGVTMEAARGYAEQMRNVYLLNEEAAGALDGSLRGIVDTLDETDKTSFMSALNALDWSSVESIESLPETLEAMGIAVPEDELQNYIELLKESAGATRKIDLEKIKETAVELTNLKKSIAGGEQGRSFSEEAYKALKEMAPDLANKFQLGLDGQYTYLGASMSELTDAIEQNTTALLSEATKELNNKIVMGELADKMTATVDGVTYNFKQMSQESFQSEDAQRAALKAFQNNMKLNGAEITGIEGFGNNTAVDKLSGDELDKIFSQLSAVSGSLEGYKKDLNDKAVEAAAVMYQGNSATENAYGASMAATYAGSSSNQQNEFNARSGALMFQATQTGVSAALVDEYAKVVEQYKKGEVAYSKVLEVQRQVANSSDYLVMRNGLKGVFEMISGVKEEYDKLADTDVEGKIALANQALAQFGVQIDDAASADKYMDILNQISQGNTAAMGELVAIAQEQAGLAVDGVNGVGNAYTQGWENLTQAQIDFYDQMATANLGHWKLLEDGSRQFVWATVAEMESIAEAAGTAMEEWENPYTWLYNQNEQLNRLSRERERTEREYTRALEDESKTAEDLLAISQKQLANLKEQSQIQAISAARALDEIKAQFDANSQFANYVRYDATTGAISVDYEGLEAAGFDSDKGSEFEKFLSVIEENRDIILDAEEALEDIEDQVEEVKNRGKEETSDLYNKIKEGLVQSRQNEIDKLSDIKESIQEAQASLIDQMQRQIDEARQARDNAKTESDIADKETQLAYLMSDTSGANKLEILSLQKEIADAKEGYTDTLIDQSIQNLQDANEKAAEQRQEQINLAQAQLDAYSTSEQIWNDVKSILDNSLSSGISFSETEAGQLAGLADGVSEMNPIEKDTWISELDKSSKLSEFYTSGQATAEAEALLEEIAGLKTNTETSAKYMGNLGNEAIPTGVNSITGGESGSNLQSIVDAINDQNITVTVNTEENDNEQPETGSGGTSSGGTSAIGGSGVDFGTGGNDVEIGTENVEGPEDVVPEPVDDKQQVSGGILPSNISYSGLNDKQNKWFDLTIDGKKDTHVETGEKYSGAGELDTLYYSTVGEVRKKGSVVFKDEDGGHLYIYGGSAWYEVLDQGADLDNSYNNRPDGLIKKAREYRTNNFKGKPFKYKTGGLADFTGPAWLDGTKSRPELVLNQTDTANFILLKDILAEILNGTSSISKEKQGKGGDNYYEVEINVESISDDYDVEQMAEKIKSMIYNDASYRNVNAVNTFR